MARTLPHSMNLENFKAALAEEQRAITPQISIGFDRDAKPGRCNVIFPDTKESCGRFAVFKGLGDCTHFRVCMQCARPYCKGGRPLEALARVEIPPTVAPENSCMVFRPTRWQRFTRWLFPRLAPNRFAQLDRARSFMTGDGIRSQTVIVLDWKDRLRILLSGRACLETSIQTEHKVGSIDSAADFNVLPPRWMDKEAGQ